MQLFLGSSSLWRTISVALISGAVSVAGFKKCVLCVESSGVVLQVLCLRDSDIVSEVCGVGL